jgi:hypothetical protein
MGTALMAGGLTALAVAAGAQERADRLPDYGFGSSAHGRTSGSAKLVGPAQAKRPLAFRVIVNGANSAKRLRRATLSGYFLKEATRWPDDGPVVAVDQSLDSRLRASFSMEILHVPAFAVPVYWQQQIFSGRNVPPAVKASDEEVIAFVKANAGAVGYVSARAALPDGVKAVRIVD